MKPNFDYDRAYIRPAAWRKAKDAFGEGTRICEAMVALEDAAVRNDCDVRFAFDLALRHFATLPAKQWEQVMFGKQVTR